MYLQIIESFPAMFTTFHNPNLFIQCPQSGCNPMEISERDLMTGSMDYELTSVVHHIRADEHPLPCRGHRNSGKALL